MEKMAVQISFCFQLSWIKVDTGRTRDRDRWMTWWIIENYFPKYLVKRRSRITVKWNCFPLYQTNTMNQWFDSHHPLLGEDECLQERTLNVMNVNKDGKRAKCYTLKDGRQFPESLADDNFEVYFHGTEHTGAKQIIEKGIRLTVGKTGRDFSSGDGFYLFQTFQEALHWAGSEHGRNSAVLCFRVNKTELRGDNNDKGLDLCGNKQQWEELVSKFWQGKKKSIIKEIGHYDFIEGPEASWSTRRLHKPLHKNGTYQLCVRKNSCARLFDRSLNSVVFFE